MSQPHPFASIEHAGPDLGARIAGHIDLAFRDIMPGRDVETPAEFIRFMTGEPHPFGNFVSLSGPVRADTVAGAIEPLVQRNAPAAVLATAPMPHEVEPLLNEAGFQRHGGMPCMAVNISDLGPTRLPEGHTFERVRGTGSRNAWADVFARGYELPPRVGDTFARGIRGDDANDAPLQYFWIKDPAGTPVCTSVLYLRDGLAGIYAVATVPASRGKGLGAFVTAEPLRQAAGLGYGVGVLQASEDGDPVYRRIGFRAFGEVPLFVRMPAN